jgi:myo-inositol 2-dehydrogenase/D-chiro-inositol 1-dehydrogenase
MTVNIGVVGTGTMAQDHIRRISEDLSGAKIIAVTDINKDLANSVAAKVGAKVYEDSAALVSAPEVDAIIVASYGPAHEESVTQAIEADKPVFCEKPLTPTAAGCLRIMDKEVAAGKRLVQVGFMRRYDPGYRDIKKVIESGELGQVNLVHNAHRNPSVNDNYTEDMAINDTAIHEFDTMRWLLDSEIVDMRVDRPRKSRNAAAHLQDPLVVVFNMANGVRVDVEVNVNLLYGYDIQCEAVFDSGAVRLGDFNTITRRDANGASNRIPADFVERFKTAYDTEIQEWIYSVRDGKIVGPSTWDGYAAAVVCDAGVAALAVAADGAPTKIELVAKPDLYR